MVRVLKAEVVRNLAYRVSSAVEQQSCLGDDALMYNILCRAVALALDQVAKVVGRQVHTLGAPRYGGQLAALVNRAGEVVVEQHIEPFHNVATVAMCRVFAVVVAHTEAK